MTAPDLAILIPCREHVHTEFMRSLLALQRPSKSVVITTRRIPLDAARNTLAQRGLDTGAEWFLWLDTDMTFPPDILERLFEPRRPFVAAPYALRSDKPRPSAIVNGAKWDGIAGEVDSVGFGCVLTHRGLFTRADPPWFDFTMARDPAGVGEDVYFAQKIADELNVRPHVIPDAGLGHLITQEARL